MYSSEVLSQLRRLDWLHQEARLLGEGTLQRSVIDSQIEALRASLPISLLGYHDERAQKKLPSITRLKGRMSCGNCLRRLPSGTLKEISRPGSFGICPHCGVFVWAGSVEALERAAAGRPGKVKKPIPVKKARPRKARQAGHDAMEKAPGIPASRPRIR